MVIYADNLFYPQSIEDSSLDIEEYSMRCSHRDNHVQKHLKYGRYDYVFVYGVIKNDIYIDIEKYCDWIDTKISHRSYPFSSPFSEIPDSSVFIKHINNLLHVYWRDQKISNILEK